MESQNTLIIGWDGAPFTEVQRWLDEGRLPNLAALADNGYFGPLETVPYVMSPCAWSTFLTGKNAGKHGVFDFYANDFREGQYFRNPIDATARKEPELWDIFNAQQQAVGSINVPVTYPATEMDEFMIGGVLSPGVNDPQFAYPSDFLSNYDGLDDYLIDLDFGKHDNREDFIDRVHEMVDRRTELILHCIDQGKDIDALLAVFTSPDRLAHYFWHFQDSEHPYRQTESDEALETYRNVVRELFEKLDEKLGLIVDRYEQQYGEPLNVAVVSDHGMDSLEHMFFVNQWLAQEGYLVFKDSEEEIDASELPEQKQYVFGKVDWEQTQAYSIGKAGDIYLNLEGREPDGIVSPDRYEEVRSEIAEDLRDTVDPRTGEPIVDYVSPREDLFDGPYVDTAPDLLVSLLDGYYSLGYLFEDKVFMRNDREDTPFVSGIESGSGIVCQSGPAFAQRDEPVEFGLVDYVPTLLHALGLALPPDTDGNVVTELVADSQRGSDVLTLSGDQGELSRPGGSERTGTAESVKERLEDLGYK